MDIAVYCGKWICPAKNGTRYMDKIFPTKSQGSMIELIKNSSKGKKVKTKCVFPPESCYLIHQTKVTHLFLRDPLSHLHSAIHTDLWGHMSTKDRNNGLRTDNPKIMELIELYPQKGTGHWCHNLYESLYWLLKKKGNVKVLPLNELTPFMESLGYKEKYNPDDYNFKNLTYDDVLLNTKNINRKEVVEWVKTNYPYVWNNIMLWVRRDSVYYNKLIKGDFGPELPKVKGLSIDDTKKFL
jgi:hypothetical protein